MQKLSSKLTVAGAIFLFICFLLLYVHLYNRDLLAWNCTEKIFGPHTTSQLYDLHELIDSAENQDYSFNLDQYRHALYTINVYSLNNDSDNQLHRTVVNLINDGTFGRQTFAQGSGIFSVYAPEVRLYNLKELDDGYGFSLQVTYEQSDKTTEPTQKIALITTSKGCQQPDRILRMKAASFLDSLGIESDWVNTTQVNYKRSGEADFILPTITASPTLIQTEGD